MILFTGSHGFIGTAVRRRIFEPMFTVDCGEPRVHQQRPVPDFLGRCSDSLFSLRETPEVIIHLAAQVGVADSAVDPQRYLRDNTQDTAAFLQRLVKLERLPKRLVVASSMSVYGDPGPLGSNVTEETPVAPASLYGLTKYDQERLCCIWGKQHRVEVIALRFFNVYGPGQALHNPYTGVLANFANWLLQGEQPLVYEDGQQTRDFVFVDDVADAVVGTAFDRHVKPGIYNVCSNEATTIQRAAEALAAALGRDITPRITGQWRLGDVRHVVGNNARLRQALPDWSPRPFAEGIEEYAAWLTR